MTDINEQVATKGHVFAVIQYLDGTKKEIDFKNTILRTGRQALASSLANSIGDTFNFYISRILFGDGGTVNGNPLIVNTERNGLFGITRASKPVIAVVDPNVPSQVTFTSVVAFSDANGQVLNEMALQMNTGDFYSMVTFPDLNKTSQMQITFNWRLSFV
jgi:hypothetical protein